MDVPDRTGSTPSKKIPRGRCVPEAKEAEGQPRPPICISRVARMAAWGNELPRVTAPLGNGGPHNRGSGFCADLWIGARSRLGQGNQARTVCKARAERPRKREATVDVCSRRFSNLPGSMAELQTYCGWLLGQPVRSRRPRDLLDREVGFYHAPFAAGPPVALGAPRKGQLSTRCKLAFRTQPFHPPPVSPPSTCRVRDRAREVLSHIVVQSRSGWH